MTPPPEVTRPAGREPQVRIVSDGRPVGTTVTVDGKQLTNVVRVEWSVEVNRYAIAVITVDNVAVDVTGQVQT